MSLFSKETSISISRNNTDSKRINVFDEFGNWISTKPIKLNQTITLSEYLLFKGKFLNKKLYAQLMNYITNDF